MTDLELIKELDKIVPLLHSTKDAEVQIGLNLVKSLNEPRIDETFLQG